MRICLIPLRIEPRRPEANWARLEERLGEAATYRPDLVCLPECTLTGYLYEEDDLRRFAEPVPGPTLQRMAGLARRHGVYLCFGLLEQALSGVYDAAVLLDQTGRLLLRHRKINEKPPFQTGGKVHCASTDLGKLGLLICGDLFCEQAVQQLDPALDLLLVPMSRSFAGRSPDGARWEAEERSAYLQAARQAARTVALVNALETGVEEAAFGGALVAWLEGDALGLAESPHGSDQLLVCDIPSSPHGSAREDHADTTAVV